jgi:transcriptional regulator with XRE-family HTH domain
LRRARTARGWSQTDFAKQLSYLGAKLGGSTDDLGVDQGRVSEWELGKTQPSATYTMLICRLLEMSPEELDLPPLPSFLLPSTKPSAPSVPPENELIARVRAIDTSVTEDEFLSIPVRTPSGGVIAYVITRRAFLATLAVTTPALAFPENIGTDPVNVGLSDMTDLLMSSVGPIDRRAIEPSSFLTVTRMLASQRQAVSPNALLSLVEAHRDSLAMLFRKAGTDPVRRDIGALLGETSIVASRLWSAIGNRSLALANCAFARQLAERLDDPTLGATARIFESNLHSDAATLIGSDGDVVLGLRMLDEAAATGSFLSPAARARIAAEQAQAYAVLRLERECQDALDRAQKAAAEIDDTDRTGLFSDWSPARLLVYEGTCWLFLGEARRAVATLSQALRASDDGNANVLLAARVDLASAYVESGELAEGCRVLGDTYARLADMGSRRGIERANRARERLALWEHEPQVRELDERVSSLALQ